MRSKVTVKEARGGRRELMLLLGLAMAASCGGADRPRPDDMSAAQHRREAAREQRAADVESSKYDPAGIHAEPQPALHDGPEDVVYGANVYDPGAYHLRNAQAHRAHAAEHERAAAALEQFESDECKELPATTRASCPLLGPATAVVDIEGGVRVELVEGVSVPAVVALMRCHYAYARTHGFADVADCPLYLRGIDIRVTADGKGVQITAPDAATVKQIRRRAREEAAAGTPTT